MYISKKISEIEHSPIRKFNRYALEAERRGVKVYRLNIGQPDVKTPGCFMEAIRSCSSDIIAYSESGGDTLLQDAMIDYFRRYDVSLTRDDIIITAGGSEALSMAFSCILDTGDNVVIAEPFYTNYRTFIAAAGGEISPITTTAETGYSYADVSLIESAINEMTRAIVCTNPGNPTGKTLSLADMELIGDIAIKHDLWLLADEVYREFTYDGSEAISFGSLERIQDRLIITDSVSKRFSACGARIGALISKNPGFMNCAMKLAQGRLSCPTLEQAGSTALYRLPASYFDTMRQEYEKRRDAGYRELSRIPGIVCSKPNGSFYIMAKLPVHDVEDFLMFLLRDFEDRGETVMFSPAKGFYMTPGLGEDEIRIACVLNAHDLERGAELIRLGLEQYLPRHSR